MVSTMWVSLRKIPIFAICLSLAVANGFMPRHAHAMTKVGPAATQHAYGDHDRAHHDHSAASKDHHEHDHGLTGNADDTNDMPGKSKSLTDNCCVASCSAIALIFAIIELSTVPLGTAFVSPRENSLVMAARSTDVPPPR
ncbi:hypothetical protein [Pseudorhodoplanes sinuspersici]|uniref:Uncharacterized protein n=1 Tax=Pseudorhodoplanes sinuspersici TaxID=1235591 RepID=A0A1W6ZZI4_9HYPH|nr:hypothetical protein [Pseudorhodoplanes sinuspersici]ARQ02165.1 hypothetical protein CAK95_25985 [Pseudorhodoplanes sinuspersici]RKE73975.1 hypothetical protein DFP91_1874 [Pseudorhodoplanes sinuspersici]